MRERYLSICIMFCWCGITFATDFVQPEDPGVLYLDGKCFEKTETPDQWMPCGKRDDMGLNQPSCESVKGVWLPHLQGCLVEHRLWTLENGKIVIKYYKGKSI